MSDISQSGGGGGARGGAISSPFYYTTWLREMGRDGGCVPFPGVFLLNLFLTCDAISDIYNIKTLLTLDVCLSCSHSLRKTFTSSWISPDWDFPAIIRFDGLVVEYSPATRGPSSFPGRMNLFLNVSSFPL